MKLTRSKKTETFLFKKFRVYLARDTREGVHVSDLISPRLAYWKRKNPLPLTEDECLYFLAGIAHHTMVVAAVTGVVGSEEEKKMDEETGILYSPDLFTMKGEFKTTRSPKVPQSEEEAKRKYAHYVKQCRAYAALMRSVTWKLIVFFFAIPQQMANYVRQKPMLRAYELLFTEAELTRERKHLAEISTLFRAALAENTDKALPLCPMWMCMEMVDGKKVGKCPWWNECKPEGRHPDSIPVATLSSLEDSQAVSPYPEF